MPHLRLEWMQTSRAQFEAIRTRARQAGVYNRFRAAHNGLVWTLSDLARALQAGEPLYHLAHPGAMVRQCGYDCLSVSYAVYPNECLGYILRYHTIPDTWPF